MDWVLLLSIAWLTAPAVEVETLDGAIAAGTLLELGPQGVKLDSGRGPVAIELDRLASMTLKADPEVPAPPPAVWLELVDGSCLVGSAYTAAEGRTRLTLTDGTPLELSTNDVKWVRFRPQTAATAAQWARFLEAEMKSDLLVLSTAEAIDRHKGLIRTVSPEVVQFELDGELLPVQRARVYGLVYYHPAGRELPQALGSVEEVSGASWSVQAVALAGQRLEWTTPTGLKVARPLAGVKRIDFSRGKVLYLSDLEPESVSWTPYIGLGNDFPAREESAAPRRDRSRDGGPLQLDGKTYNKGLALASRTLLVYRLPERFRRLVAVAGIDDRVRPHGHVRLEIRGDQKVLLETTLCGREPARPLSVELAGVRRLAILVDFGEDLDVADHLDLGEARLVK
ncbi:MAG: NPCBM/NEW2 domain-containing protein [Thermoguttaceae bacterium]